MARTEQINLRLTPEDKIEIDRLAATLQIRRSDVVRLAVENLKSSTDSELAEIAEQHRELANIALRRLQGGGE